MYLAKPHAKSEAPKGWFAVRQRTDTPHLRHADWLLQTTTQCHGHPMLETIAVLLVILWLLGVVSSYTMGGLVHILLVLALVVVLARLIRGRRL